MPAVCPAMQVADAIEPLYDDGEERNQPNQQHAVLLVMANMLQAVAVLGIIEALVLDFPAALANVIEGQAAYLTKGKVGQPLGLDDTAIRFVLAITDDADAIPAQGFPGSKIVGIPDLETALAAAAGRGGGVG